LKNINLLTYYNKSTSSRFGSPNNIVESIDENCK